MNKKVFDKIRPLVGKKIETMKGHSQRLFVSDHVCQEIIDMVSVAVANESDKETAELRKHVLDESGKPLPWEKIPEESRMAVLGSYLKELVRITDEEQNNARRTFAMPSNFLMFTLLAMFAGKTEKIPRKLLIKPPHQRTEREQKEADELIRSILRTERDIDYTPEGKEVIREREVAIVSDNPRVEAEAEIDPSLFPNYLNDPSWFAVREGRLAYRLRTTFGPEGLRHLLGYLIALEESGRSGTFEWEINEHLKRLGYKKDKGAYRTRDKKTASEILQTLTSLSITATEKKGKKESVSWNKLFLVAGGTREINNKRIIRETVTIQAAHKWYESAIHGTDDQGPQYTKLLKRIATTNHRNNPLTLYLGPLFAIWWRMKPKQELTIKRILEWCDLGKNSKRLREEIRDLEGELNYMKSHGYLGEWSTKGGQLPSEHPEPLKCVLTFSPPEWFQEDIKAIEEKREAYLFAPGKELPLTRKEFTNVFEASKLSQRAFGNNLGVSHQMIGAVLRGEKQISPKLSKKVREMFLQKEAGV